MPVTPLPNLVADCVASEPDEIWVGDVTYMRLGTEFIDLAMIMDVFSGTFAAGKWVVRWGRS